MNKNESKYFNTAVKMNKALIELLEKKDFEYITIKEICEKAGVNRSTFYLHYENTTDLLNETTQYITDNFLSYFSTGEKNFSYDFEHCDLHNLFLITPEYILPYLSYVKDNQRVFKTALRQFGTMNFDAVYKKMFIYIFDPILKRFDFPEKERKYVMKFYLTGITAIVGEWLNDNCSLSEDDVSKIIMECIIGKQNLDKYL